MANTGAVLGGGLQGAGTGATAGAMFGPVGIGVGAGIGLLAGGLGGYFASEAEEEQARAQQQAIEEQRRILEGNFQTSKGYLDPYSQAGSQALGQYQNYDPSLNQQDFSYGRSVESFLDPSIAFQQDQARRQLEASAGAQGGLYSGAQMMALSDRAQNIGQLGYQQAFQNQQTDRNFNFQDYTNRWESKRIDRNNRMNQLKGIVDLGANAAGDMAQMRMGLNGSQMGLAQQSGDVNAMQNSAGSRAMGGAMGNILNQAPQMMGAYQQGVTNNLQQDVLRKQLAGMK